MPRKSHDAEGSTAAELAETLALRALAFLAGEPERLGRFLALTGIGPDRLRAAAGTPETLAAVLDYLLADESLLLTFTSGADVKPYSVGHALAVLTRETRSLE